MQKLIWNELSDPEKLHALQRPAQQQATDRATQTQTIIDEVREKGDEAARYFTHQFDNVDLTDFKVTEAEIDEAREVISPKAKVAISQAANNIKNFHQAQEANSVKLKTAEGIVCEKQVRPIQRVGLYVPGGSAPLPSTVLMLGIPALLAECPSRIMVTPPSRSGLIDPHILFAASLCEITDIYKIGGAQAIAAMAYGTETVPKVDKIFGPGNAWVTQAKVLVAQDPQGAAYDMPAGPSEVLIIADEHANPAFIAADLLSQAEHGADSQVILISDTRNVAEKVIAEIKEQQEQLPRQNIIEQSLLHSRVIIVEKLKQAFAISNQYAPEHLILHVDNPRQWIASISCAGSVFLGPWSPESAGDYASGTNHVLPTYGYSRAFSGLSLNDFVTWISFQELTPAGLSNIAECIETLADIEGLHAHRNAVSIRMQEIKK